MLKKEKTFVIMRKNRKKKKRKFFKTKGDRKMSCPELVVMLTHNDVTVKNSKEIFLEAKDAPCGYWGFKEVGLPPEEMKDLVRCMKDAGKTTFMEIVAKTEEDCSKAVKLGIESGFDAILGTVYYDSILEMVKEHHITYFPFIGERYTESIRGTIEELKEEAACLAEKDGVTGINVAAYRYDGNVEELLTAISDTVKKVNKPLSIVGSINSYERLDMVKKFNPRTYTIGGAFFENKFGETFSEQIETVQNYMKKGER